jgi:hypothetical protein
VHGDPDPAVRALIDGPRESAEKHVADATASLIHPDHRTGFACTGFSLPGGWTADGRHLHARNLDADLYNCTLLTR